jgi:hypothetical protein
LKKVMLLPALLAIVVIAAAPALAQVEQEDEQEGESGEVDQSFEISGSGSNATPVRSNTGHRPERQLAGRDRLD